LYKFKPFLLYFIWSFYNWPNRRRWKGTANIFTYIKNNRREKNWKSSTM